jgi:prophage antirepressor-like protein
MNNQLTPFEGTEIRKIWHDEQWYFSVVDVIGILTDSKDARNYWKVLKNRESQLVTICTPLKLTSLDGKKRLSDCANTENIFIITMSVPSPKAHSLKLWLAQAGKEKLHRLSDSMSILELISNHAKLYVNSKVCDYKTYLMLDILRGFYKIGKSRNPQIRENTLQAEVPSIELLHVIQDDIELYLHEKFNSKRLRGEWFELSESDVNYIKSY